MRTKEKIQSQFSDDAKVKGAALMVSADPSSRETKQRKEREIDISSSSVPLPAGESRSKEGL